MVWLPALLAAELLRPRLRYDVRRWSTVFPVGMYAACSFVVGDVAHAAAISDFARVWVWVGVAVWVVMFAAMLVARSFWRARAENLPGGSGLSAEPILARTAPVVRRRHRAVAPPGTGYQGWRGRAPDLRAGTTASARRAKVRAASIRPKSRRAMS